MSFSEEYLRELCIKVEGLSREVGKFLLEEQKNFSTDFIENKGVNNLVSYVDKIAEKKFVTGLNSILPEAGFIAEEGSGEKNLNGLNWVIDPLDGTTNFIHHLPFYCTSVALLQNHTPILGVIFDPSHNELFSSYGNVFTMCNGKPIGVSEISELKNMLIVTGFPYDDRGLLANNLKAIECFSKESRGIRRLGSAALDMAYVACGRFDGFYEYGLNPWDVAAGTILIRNAGGVVTDFKGGDNPIFGEQIIASSSASFKLIQEIVAKSFQIK
jgi:myo-inositol-1(or 4)-monophosphatase